jgi:hypothetical protein
VRDTESFARRRPEVFLGGTILAGLMLARFLKASAPDTAAGSNGSSYSAGAQAAYQPVRPGTGARTQGGSKPYAPSVNSPAGA